MNSKKVQDLFGETFILILSIDFSSLSSTKLCHKFLLLNLGDKRLLSDFMRKWGWFHGHNVCFPKNLGTKLKFQKIQTCFCRLNSNDYNNINIFLSLERLCAFLLVKEKTWKRIFTLFPETRGIACARTGTHTSKFTCATYCMQGIIVFSLSALLLLYTSHKEKFFIEGFAIED